MKRNLSNVSMNKKLNELIEKFTFVNAYTHSGKSQPKAVLGKILGEVPEHRQKAREILDIIGKKAEEVNRLSLEKQRGIIESRWPEALVKSELKTEEKILSPLSNVEKYAKVITRFSPNPDCVLHMGSARAIILSYEYARMYKGEFYLRFEDTDPKQKKPKLEFYDSIREDLTWLNCKWDKEFLQSERLEVYYEHLKKLFNLEKAYICTCEPNLFKEKTLAEKPCFCRNQAKEENYDRWEKMLNGEYDEGEAVVRVKTDLHHPNPAVRDWPAFRIIDTKRTPHPKMGDKYRVWPLYNFSCGVDDHLMEVSHVIRGKEHLTNEVRQRFMYSYFDWKYPETIHYGRLKITGTTLSKSKIKLGIEEKFYEGYDDPRLATFITLRRRGIRPEAIRRMMLDIGTKPIDITLSWQSLYANNRRIIDPIVARYFFVEDPLTLKIKNVVKPYTAKINLHPDHPEWGIRTFEISPKKEELTLLMSKSDLELLKPEITLRLIGLFNIRIEKVSENLVEATYHSETYEASRRLHAKLIHYLPAGTGIPTKVIMPDASTVEGLAENNCKNLQVGQTIQFERFGFVRIDKSNGIIVVRFTHR
ncbi:MAG: glutamate--tRNA ligase [Candidatus Bathyarchaeota archaeon]